ncbi:MAG: hypothetical protein AB7I79_22125 [Rhizobiaceae bacterium]
MELVDMRAVALHHQCKEAAQRGRQARCVARQDSPFHQGRHIARSSSHAPCALPNRTSDLEDERIRADLARKTPRRINDDDQESLLSAI